MKARKKKPAKPTPRNAYEAAWAAELERRSLEKTAVPLEEAIRMILGRRRPVAPRMIEVEGRRRRVPKYKPTAKGLKYEKKWAQEIARRDKDDLKNDVAFEETLRRIVDPKRKKDR